MGRYTKGKAIAQGNVGVNPRFLSTVKRDLCPVCLSSGIVKTLDGFITQCQNGCKSRSHKVKKMLAEQTKLYARLEGNQERKMVIPMLKKKKLLNKKKPLKTGIGKKTSNKPLQEPRTVYPRTDEQPEFSPLDQLLAGANIDRMSEEGIFDNEFPDGVHNGLMELFSSD